MNQASVGEIFALIVASNKTKDEAERHLLMETKHWPDEQGLIRLNWPEFDGHRKRDPEEVVQIVKERDRSSSGLPHPATKHR